MHKCLCMILLKKGEPWLGGAQASSAVSVAEPELNLVGWLVKGGCMLYPGCNVIPLAHTIAPGFARDSQNQFAADNHAVVVCFVRVRRYAGTWRVGGK